MRVDYNVGIILLITLSIGASKGARNFISSLNSCSPHNPCACYINTSFFGVNSKYISSAVHLHFHPTISCLHLTATVCLLQPCLTGRASCASRRAPTVRPLAARAMRLPTATSPATCSSAAAMTPASAAASTKTTCARRREASVFPRPTAAPSPTLTPPVSPAPLASAACRTQLPVTAAITSPRVKVRVRATDTTTVDKETRFRAPEATTVEKESRDLAPGKETRDLASDKETRDRAPDKETRDLASDKETRDLASDKETRDRAPDKEVSVPTVGVAVMAVIAVVAVIVVTDDTTKHERTFHPGHVVLLMQNYLLCVAPYL